MISLAKFLTFSETHKDCIIVGPPKDQGIIPRSLEVIFNSVGDKQYESADLRPQLYCEVKRLTGKDMFAADKFKTMVLNASSVSNFVFIM